VNIACSLGAFLSNSDWTLPRAARLLCPEGFLPVNPKNGRLDSLMANTLERQTAASGPRGEEGLKLGRPEVGIRATRVLLLAVGTLVGASLSIPVAYLFGVRGGDLQMFSWAVLTFVVAMIPLLVDQTRSPARRHILLTVVTLAFMVQFAMPILTLYVPAVGLMDPSGMAGASLSPRDIVRSQQISLVGLCSLLLAYSLPLGRLVASVVPPRQHEWKESFALVASGLLIFIGWILTLGRQFGAIGTQLGSGFIGGFSESALFGSAWLMATYLAHRSRTALLMLLLMVPTAMSFNFLTGSKRLFLTPPAMIALTWIITERRVRASWVLAGVISLVVLYPVAQFWRDDVLVRNTLTAADIMRNPGPAIERTAAFLSSGRAGDYLAEGLEATGRRIDAVGHAAVIIRDTPAVSPFQDGRTLSLIPIAFVPRVLWPGKPTITIGQWITDTYTIVGSKIDSRIGPSWIGEFYLNFAVPGVVVGMFVLGFLLRFAHEVILGQSPTIPLTIAAVIIMYKVALAVQGGVVGAVNGPIIALIPLALVHGAVRFFGGTRPVSSWPSFQR